MNKLMTILLVLAVLAGCSQSSPSLSKSVSAEMTMEDSSLQLNEQDNDQVETIERKIIKQGQIRFQTADVNSTKSLIAQAVQELNGYIANDNVYDYSDRFEHTLTIRVPAAHFDLLLHEISESVDKLDSKNIDAKDVTEEFIDIEARIKTKKELQIRYIELLKRATKVDEILNIEREIGKLQTEIESVEGRMSYLKDRIAFSTLTVTYYQKATSTFGFSSKFVDGVKQGWSVFLWFIVGLAHLWVFIVVVVAIVLIVRWRRKRRKNFLNKLQ